MDGDRYRQLEAATAAEDPPFAVLDRTALDANADDLVRRAAGMPIRVATKSVRCRPVLDRILTRPGFAGLMTYTLPESLWLVDQGATDVLVAYPTVHRAAVAELAADQRALGAVTVMVDSEEHLDLLAAAIGEANGAGTGRGAGPEPRRLRVCLEIDASYVRGPLRIGTLRSPLFTPADAARLAAAAGRRPELQLVGLMLYEGQIAGVGDAGRSPRQAVLRRLQAASRSELAERRAAIVEAVTAVADHPLEFVNGGGTGSLESTSAEAAVTEVTAGSGLYGPGLFDRYTRFTPEPALHFVLDVVRRPDARTVTVLGGGWIASGPPGMDRLPTVAHPAGLHYQSLEGAGEVQTPLRGKPAAAMRVGDRVWFRHAKAGEVCEHVNELLVVDGDRIVDRWPTYRGEGKAWL